MRSPTSTAKRAWARLIKQVYEADPLVCDRCADAMRILAFIEQPEVMSRSSATSACGPPARTARLRGTRRHPLGNGSSPRNHTAFSARRDRSPDLAPPLVPGSAEARPAAVQGAHVPP